MLVFLLFSYFSHPSLAFHSSLSFNRQPRGEHAVTTSSSHSILGMQASSSSFRLGYITDVEGNLDYFKSFVRQSQVLDLVNENDNDDGMIELTLRDDDDDKCYFVYGGDTVDKGPGDIRLCRALVQLKQRYPDRVALLVGNRDLNKLRLTAELSKDDLNRPIEEIPPPHWDPAAPTLKEYLESMIRQEGKNGTNATLDDLNTRVNRLKYMLIHTLGCPKSFEFRRQELSVLKRTPMENITDNQVVDSFLEEVQEGGCLRQYLELGQVAAVFGNTLFVHGAVDVNTMKFVPSLESKFENPKSKPAPGMMCDDLNEWVKELNEYLKLGLQDYKKRPLWDDKRTTRGGESLMALQNRPAMWGRSIISNCYGDGGCITTSHATSVRTDPTRIEQEAFNPLVFEKVASDPMDETVASWLLQHGIQRLVVGHKPTGDCPAVLSASYTGVEIISADTSFSDTSAADNRGAAVAIVEIVGRSTIDNHLELCGAFQDGTAYQCQFPRLYSESKNTANWEVDEGDANLGTQLQDGWWVKARTKDKYHLCRGQGRRVEYKTIPIQEL